MESEWYGVLSFVQESRECGWKEIYCWGISLTRYVSRLIMFSLDRTFIVCDQGGGSWVYWRQADIR